MTVTDVTRASWTWVPISFFKFKMLMVRCHVDEKNGVLELGELEYHKKWYFPNYFRNSVSDPIISKLSANGPFWPLLSFILFLFPQRPNTVMTLETTPVTVPTGQTSILSWPQWLTTPKLIMGFTVFLLVKLPTKYTRLRSVETN